MNRTVNMLLARIAHPMSENLLFPFSRQVDGCWYDCATDGHRLLAIESEDPHFSPTLGPRVEDFLVPPRTKYCFDGTALEELIAVAKACPKYKRNARTLRLTQGESLVATVNPDLFIGIVEACQEETIVVSLRGPIDPVRIDGIRSERIGSRYARVIGILMPVRASAQEELPGVLAQMTLSFQLPEQMYGEIDLGRKAPPEKAAAE